MKIGLQIFYVGQKFDMVFRGQEQQQRVYMTVLLISIGQASSKKVRKTSNKITASQTPPPDF